MSTTKLPDDAQKLWKLRKSRGFTQLQLAAALDYGIRVIQEIEAGRQPISRRLHRAIDHIFGAPLEELLAQAEAAASRYGGESASSAQSADSSARAAPPRAQTSEETAIYHAAWRPSPPDPLEQDWLAVLLHARTVSPRVRDTALGAGIDAALSVPRRLSNSENRAP